MIYFKYFFKGLYRIAIAIAIVTIISIPTIASFYTNNGYWMLMYLPHLALIIGIIGEVGSE